MSLQKMCIMWVHLKMHEGISCQNELKEKYLAMLKLLLNN